MFVHYKTNGVFLKKIDKGEADQLFTIYTKDFGRVEVCAKGIRKMTSKLRSQARLLSLSEIEFIQGKAGKTLTDSCIAEKFETIGGNLEKTETAGNITSLLDLTLKGQEKDERIWQKLLEALGFLKTAKAGEAGIVYHHFFWGFMACLGYRPQFEVCCFCKKKPAGSVLYFMPSEGGVSCGSCRSHKEPGCLIDQGILKILRLFQTKNLEAASMIKLTPRQEDALKQVSVSFLSTIL